MAKTSVRLCVVSLLTTGWSHPTGVIACKGISCDSEKCFRVTCTISGRDFDRVFKNMLYDGAKKYTDDEILGHEQRHITSFYDEMKKLAKELRKEIGGKYSDKLQADNRAKQIERTYQPKLDQADWNEAYHVKGMPAKGQGYSPLGPDGGPRQ